jgi:predicted MFS family arabinose efflux permease
VFAPFRVRTFRFQWPADLVTSWAFEMETLILGWYVLVQTGSVVMLTLFGAMNFLGTLIAPMMGVLGDRIGQRFLLSMMRGFYAVLAATMGTLAFTGVLSPVYVFLLSGLQGLVRPSDQGVRGALTAATMPPEYLVGAMSISRTTLDSARIMGALAGAGMFVTYGIGPAYLVITALYTTSALFTLGVARDEIHHPHDAMSAGGSRPSPWRDLTQGIAYIWSTRRLMAIMWLVFLLNLTAFPLLNGLMPYVAREVYRVDQTGLSYLVAGLSTGALLGSVVLGMVGSQMRLERIIIFTAILWYTLLLVFAQTESLHGGVASLLFVGIAQSLTMVSLAVILMQTSSAQYRGRVMGVRMLAIYSLPIGLLTAGALIERIGFGATATLYASVGLVCSIVIGARWRTALWQAAEANAGPQ